MTQPRTLATALLAFAALSGPAAGDGPIDRPTDPPPPPGLRFDLGGGATLFIPEGYKPGPGDAVNVVFHLHGTPRVLEPALVAARRPAVLVAFNRNGLSQAYAGPFSNPKVFHGVLNDALGAVKQAGLAVDPKLDRVVLSSFSAGFGGVREILKQREALARLDGLVMVDSLYCGYAGDPAAKAVDPALMAGFRAFAAEAAAGKKTFLLTHSAQVPGGYASTTETADDLIRGVGGAPKAVNQDWGKGWTLSRFFAKGKFEVLGFDGGGPDDHLRQFREIARLWTRYSELRGDAPRPAEPAEAPARRRRTAD